MMRPVFNTIFESYTKMWDADTFSQYFDPEGYEEITDGPKNG
jgi:hypothetical protein